MAKSTIGYPEFGFRVDSNQFSQGSLEELEATINAKIDKHSSELKDLYSDDDVRVLRPRWLENEWRNIVNNFPGFISIHR